MKTIKVNNPDFKDLVLDYAVAQIDPQCEGLKWAMRDGLMCGMTDNPDKPGTDLVAVYLWPDGFVTHTQMRIKRESELRFAVHYCPTSEFSPRGYKLLSQNGISTRYDHRRKVGWGAYIWKPTQHDLTSKESEHYLCHGPTQLIAGLRTLVMNTYGDTVEVPEELI